MPDEQPPSSGGPEQPDRRRPAPTIDLKATEIASDRPPVAEPEPPPGSEHPEPPPERHDSASESRAETASRRLPVWLPVGTAMAGAALTVTVIWLVGLGASRDSDTGAMEARVAKLEQQIADLNGRPAPPGPDLAARLQKLETQVEALSAVGAPPGDPGLASRLTAIETEMHSLRAMAEALSGRAEDLSAGLADARRRADANAAAIAELAQKPAPASPAGESGDVAAMLSALMDRVGALEARPPAAADGAARTAAVAAALVAAVERGAPFAAELKAAQSQAADPKALAPLAPFAASGLPSPSALARELAALEPQLVAATDAAPTEGGLLEKLEANAQKLIRIRPIDQAQSGDQPLAILTRAEFKASHGDLPDALAELAKLPAPVRALAEPWIEKAQARTAALAASRKFAADALAALGRP
jgi:hypothetical protein